MYANRHARACVCVCTRIHRDRILHAALSERATQRLNVEYNIIIDDLKFGVIFGKKNPRKITHVHDKAYVKKMSQTSLWWATARQNMSNRERECEGIRE